MNNYFNREAADEVMGAYRNSLEKINGSRDKTDSNINKIKLLMAQADSDSQRVEATIRGKC